MTVFASSKKLVYNCCYNYKLLRHKNGDPTQGEIGAFVIRKNQNYNDGVERQLNGGQLRFQYNSIEELKELSITVDI